MKKILHELHVWLLPSHHNDFHPHLLAKRGLLILFALILGAEGFLVSNVIASQSGVPSIAAVGAYQEAAASLPPGISAATRVWMETVVGPIGNVTILPGMGRWAWYVLLCTTAALMTMLALTISARRYRYKPIGFVAGGMMLVVAVAAMYFNMYTLLPSLNVKQTTASLAQWHAPHNGFPVADPRGESTVADQP